MSLNPPNWWPLVSLQKCKDELDELKEKCHALELALCASQDEYDTLVRRLEEFVKDVKK